MQPEPAPPWVRRGKCRPYSCPIYVCVAVHLRGTIPAYCSGLGLGLVAMVDHSKI